MEISSFRPLKGSENGDIEANYGWVHFSLSAPVLLKDQEIFVYGKFNNYELNEENKMFYNPALETYEGVMLLNTRDLQTSQIRCENPYE